MTGNGLSVFKAGGGLMGAKLRAFDWGETSLGALSTWSLAMRVAVTMDLLFGFPKCFFFGPDLICTYNDAYAPILVNIGDRFRSSA